VAIFSSLRTVFALTAEHNLELHQMDVKAAYLNADLKKDLYMEVPPGFEIPEGHVLKLKKGVYGTKQGGHIWYEDMRGTLSELGYTHTEADHTVFVRPSDGIPDIITLYMDDMGLISESLERILQDKKALRQFYQMTNLSEMGWILGIRIIQDCEKGTLTLCNAPSGALGSPTRTRGVTQGNSEGTGFSEDPSTQDSGEGSGVEVEV
jgi:hypothetical protein